MVRAAPPRRVTDETGVGTLKLVVAGPGDGRSLELIEAAMQKHAGAEQVRRVGPGIVVFTGASVAAVRDRVRDALGAGESALVVEFERWSSVGDGVDAEWLLRRGH